MTDTSSNSPDPTPAPATGLPAINFRGVALPLIRLDGGTQCRATLDSEHIEHLVEVLESGGSLPPALVFHDGINLWLADGFHRYHAAQHREVAELWCEVRSGTQLDAIAYAVGANQTHGLRRTNADKRKAVEVALRTWPAESSREIARRCVVSDTFVNNLRNPAPEATSLIEPPPAGPAANTYGAPHEEGDPALIERNTPQTSAAATYDGPSTEEIGQRLAREDRVAKLPALIERARETIKTIRTLSDKRILALLLSPTLQDRDFAAPRSIRSDAAERQGVKLPAEVLDLDHDWNATLGLATLENCDQVAIVRTLFDSTLVRADEVLRSRGSKGHAGDFLRAILSLNTPTDLLGFEEETPAGQRRLHARAQDELRAGSAGADAANAE